jgi:hypothetical protein
VKEPIAMERYKAMLASKKRAFTLQYCWKFLRHLEKWKLSVKVAPPKKGAMLCLDDASEGGANQEQLDGNKKVKEKIKVEPKSLNLASKIDEFVRSKKNKMLKTLEKKAITEKKNEMKQADGKQLVTWGRGC